MDWEERGDLLLYTEEKKAANNKNTLFCKPVLIASFQTSKWNGRRRVDKILCTLVSSIRSFSVDSIEDDSEDKQGAQPGQGCQRVRVQDARDEEREDLPRGHDNREHHRPELLDRVVDEQLPSGRGNGQNGHVQESAGIRENERQRGQELAGLEQGQPSQQLHSKGSSIDRFRFSLSIGS